MPCRICLHYTPNSIMVFQCSLSSRNTQIKELSVILLILVHCSYLVSHFTFFSHVWSIIKTLLQWMSLHLFSSLPNIIRHAHLRAAPARQVAQGIFVYHDVINLSLFVTIPQKRNKMDSNFYFMKNIVQHSYIINKTISTKHKM